MHTDTQYSTGNEYTHKKRARLRSPPPYTLEPNICFSNFLLEPSEAATGSTSDVRPNL